MVEKFDFLHDVLPYREAHDRPTHLILSHPVLAHDGFAHVANGAVADQRDGQHDDAHVVKDGAAVRVGVHEHAQSQHHGQHNGVVDRLVDFALNENAKNHGKDDATALHERLGGVVDVLHGKICHGQVDGAQQAQAQVEHQRDALDECRVIAIGRMPLGLLFGVRVLLLLVVDKVAHDVGQARVAGKLQCGQKQTELATAELDRQELLQVAVEKRKKEQSGGADGKLRVAGEMGNVNAQYQDGFRQHGLGNQVFKKFQITGVARVD